MRLHAFAISNADPLLAEFCMHGTIVASQARGEPVACGACLIEPAITAVTFSPDEGDPVAYGLCVACYSDFPNTTKVGELVERNISSGRLVPEIDISDDGEGES